MSPPDAAVIMRRPVGRQGGDVVVIGPSTSAAQLLDGLLALNNLRQAYGDTTHAPLTARVRTGVLPTAASNELRLAKRIIDEIGAATPSMVHGIGRVRSRTVYLPSKTMREAGAHSPPKR